MVPGDEPDSGHQLVIRLDNRHWQILRDPKVVGALQPVGVLHVTPSLIALPAGRRQIVFVVAWATAFPQHQMVHGERDATRAAVPAVVEIPLEDLPRDPLLDGPLALAEDGLDQLPAGLVLDEDFRFLNVELLEELQPIGEVHLQRLDLVPVRSGLRREHAEVDGAVVAAENGTGHPDLVPNVQDVQVTEFHWRAPQSHGPAGYAGSLCMAQSEAWMPRI